MCVWLLWCWIRVIFCSGSMPSLCSLTVFPSTTVQNPWQCCMWNYWNTAFQWRYIEVIKCKTSLNEVLLHPDARRREEKRIYIIIASFNYICFINWLSKLFFYFLYFRKSIQKRPPCTQEFDLTSTSLNFGRSRFDGTWSMLICK